MGRGRFTYVGRVGTGFTEADLDDLRVRMERLRRDASPFGDELTPADGAGASRGRHRDWWARCGSRSERTRTGRLRHPTWRGLRLDKRPGQVVREP